MSQSKGHGLRRVLLFFCAKMTAMTHSSSHDMTFFVTLEMQFSFLSSNNYLSDNHLHVLKSSLKNGLSPAY
jgi:hypothetical protein